MAIGILWELGSLQNGVYRLTNISGQLYCGQCLVTACAPAYRSIVTVALSRDKSNDLLICTDKNTDSLR